MVKYDAYFFLTSCMKMNIIVFFLLKEKISVVYF